MAKQRIKPSEAELDILRIVWDNQPVTVRFVHEELCKRKKVGYTTTLKQMQRMVDKKMIRRYAGEDKSHVYKALLNEQETCNGLFDRLMETAFKGSAMNMVMHALGRSKTSQDEIKALKKWLDNMEGGNV